MKKRVFLITILCLLFSSCLTTSGKSVETIPKKVSKALKDADTIAVLGYNSSKGLDDRLLDQLSGSPFDISIDIDISLDNKVKFPVGNDISYNDEKFISALTEANIDVISKDKVISSAMYKAIKGDPSMEINNVSSAEGYTLTYKFNNFMDSQNSIPLSGEIVNNYKGVLESLGADLGIIVVHKPYIRTRTFGLIPDKLFNGKKNYYTVSVQTQYNIIKPALGNQVIYTKYITVDSNNKVYTKGYTKQNRKRDENGFVDQVPVLIDKSHSEFVAWLNKNI